MKTTRTITTRYCIVTVRRPNGEIETLRHPAVTTMTASSWKQMIAAMRQAGRGECLSYENKTETTEQPLTLAEQRKELGYDLSAAIDHEREAMNRAVRSSVMQRDYPTLKAAVTAAEQALADFDAAHPEILAAIKAAQRESAERHMWD